MSKICTIKGVEYSIKKFDLIWIKVPYKDDHLKKVAKLEKDGSLVFGGSFFPNTGANLIFSCKDETIPNDFVKNVRNQFSRSLNENE